MPYLALLWLLITWRDEHTVMREETLNERVDWLGINLEGCLRSKSATTEIDAGAISY